jgi:O-antigen ligase
VRTAHPAPTATARPAGASAGHGIDAVSLLTVYLVLLLAIPSGVVVSVLGSLGRPSLIWGLILLGWWAVTKLQSRPGAHPPPSQPVRFAFVAFLVFALVSFAAAMLRGQPTDQEIPAITALIRILSWAGVMLVAMDGISTTLDLARMVRRIGIGAGLLAMVGLAQFLTGSPLVDFFGAIPGLTFTGGIGERGGAIRSSGTAMHPLEYATLLNAALPLVIAAAISRGFRSQRPGSSTGWWLLIALITISSLVAVSRSATIGLAVAVLLMIPTLPSRLRLIAIGAGSALAVVVFIAIPGLLSTTVRLFTGAAVDPSTLSRTAALDRVAEFMSPSPLFGTGFGIFLPRYYIFDNQWVLMLIEVGILGTVAFAAVFITSIFSAGQAGLSHDPDLRLLGYSLGASIFTIALLFAFFDGLSFPIAGGMLFLLAGLCGSVRAIAPPWATR